MAVLVEVAVAVDAGKLVLAVDGLQEKLGVDDGRLRSVAVEAVLVLHGGGGRKAREEDDRQDRDDGEKEVRQGPDRQGMVCGSSHRFSPSVAVLVTLLIHVHRPAETTAYDGIPAAWIRSPGPDTLARIIAKGGRHSQGRRGYNCLCFLVFKWSISGGRGCRP